MAKDNKKTAELVSPVNRVGKMIKKYRDDNNLTMLDLAKELNYNYGNFIGMIEAGKSIFPLNRWKDYANAIQADHAEFLVAALSDVYPNMEEVLKPLLSIKKKK